jgi:ribosomal protein S18 acetylase RimI-like enzyme
LAVTIRPAVAADYSAIAVLAREILAYHVAAIPDTFRETNPALSEEYFDELLKSAASSLLVADNAGTLVGYVVCEAKWVNPSPMIIPRRIASIEEIMVTKGMRGRGIGQALFDACVRWAQGHGADHLTLQVWEFNQDAIAFYERRGMTTLHRHMTLPLR